MKTLWILAILYLLGTDQASAAETNEATEQKAPLFAAYVANQRLWYEGQGAKASDKAFIETSAYLNENFYAGTRLGQNCCIGWHLSAESSHVLVKAYASLAFDQHGTSKLSFTERAPARSRSLRLGFRVKHLTLGYVAWGETTFKSVQKSETWHTGVPRNDDALLSFTGAFIGLGFSI